MSGFSNNFCSCPGNAAEESIVASEEQFLKCIMQAVSGFAKGLAPLTAVEIARRSLDSHVQPNGAELEKTLKSLGAK